MFQFSAADFHSVKPRLIKLVLLVRKRRNPQALLVKILLYYCRTRVFKFMMSYADDSCPWLLSGSQSPSLTNQGRGDIFREKVSGKHQSGKTSRFEGDELV